MDRLDCHLSNYAFACDEFPSIVAHDSPQADLRRAHVESCLLKWLGQWTQLHTLVVDTSDCSYPGPHARVAGAPPLHVMLPIVAAAVGGALCRLRLNPCVLGPAAEAGGLPAFTELEPLTLRFDCVGEVMPSDDTLRTLMSPVAFLHTRLPPGFRLDLSPGLCVEGLSMALGS